MDWTHVLIAVAVASSLLAAATFAMHRHSRRRIVALEDALQATEFAKRSQSTRYGQITEQFAPFMADWPWDAKRFKFLGDPIDGVQFTPAGIVFVEIKSAGSRLSAVQREVRDHVQAGRVYWHEQRIS